MDKPVEDEFSAEERARLILTNYNLARKMQGDIQDKITATEIADPDQAMSLAVAVLRAMLRVNEADIERVQAAESLDTSQFPEELLIRLDAREPEIRRITKGMVSNGIKRINNAFDLARKGNFIEVKRFIGVTADIAGRKTEGIDAKALEGQLAYAGKLHQMNALIPDTGAPLAIAA